MARRRAPPRSANDAAVGGPRRRRVGGHRDQRQVAAALAAGSDSNNGAAPIGSGNTVVARLARASGLVTIAENRTDGWRMLAPDAAVNSGAAIRTDTQSRAALTLAQGQSLRLDMDTQVLFESESRVRLERGSVYLDSGKRLDAKRAAGVEVVTPFGTLRDVGTQFEVSLINSGLRVRVREGEVALVHQDVRAAATRGESVSVARDGTVTRGSCRLPAPSGPGRAPRPWISARRSDADGVFGLGGPGGKAGTGVLPMLRRNSAAPAWCYTGRLTRRRQPKHSTPSCRRAEWLGDSRADPSSSVWQPPANNDQRFATPHR